MLDDIITRNDMLSDPLADLESDQIIREFLQEDEEKFQEADGNAAAASPAPAARGKKSARRTARQAGSR